MCDAEVEACMDEVTPLFRCVNLHGELHGDVTY
jgi:hypothetical protein